MRHKCFCLADCILTCLYENCKNSRWKAYGVEYGRLANFANRRLLHMCFYLKKTCMKDKINYFDPSVLCFLPPTKATPSSVCISFTMLVLAC